MHAFDVLGDPVRRRILQLLAEEESSAGDVVSVIEREFGITQSVVSRHLRVLLDEWLEQFRGLWEDKLEALATEVARGRRRR